jgi:superfamily I DNA/RNA helicase
MVVLSVRQAKGLEFDSVVVADPAGILAESARGRSDLYVAMTRATHRLTLVVPRAPDSHFRADSHLRGDHDLAVMIEAISER